MRCWPMGGTVRAAVSVGTNPTTDTDGGRKVEAYLMDGFAEDLYDQPLALDFRDKVRDEQQVRHAWTRSSRRWGRMWSRSRRSLE